MIRRLAILTGATLAVCFVTWGLVDAFASTPARRRRAAQWVTPEWSDMASRVGGQLLIVAIIALAGRKVLKIRL